MNKYEVVFQVSVEVEAENERDAQVIAEEEFAMTDACVDRCMAVFEVNE